MGAELDRIAAEIISDREERERLYAEVERLIEASSRIQDENEGLRDENTGLRQQAEQDVQTIEGLRDDVRRLSTSLEECIASLEACQAALEQCRAGGGVDPDPEPEPEPEPEPVISSILRPMDGKLLIGSTVGSASVGGGASFEAVTGRPVHIAHQYARDGAQFARRLASTPLGTIPFINLKPNGDMGGDAYADVVGGWTDASLATAADAAISYGKPFFLTFMHEPENDDRTGDSDDLYAAAYRYCVTYFRDRGVTNAVFVWNMMGWRDWGPRYDRLWPGREYVDWAASDPYVRTASISSFSEFVNVPWSDGQVGYGGFYDWVQNKAPGIPVMLAEWGIESRAVGSVDGAVSKLLTAEAVDRMMFEMPHLKALVYWNAVTYRADGSIENDYRFDRFPGPMERFANLPVFDLDVSALGKSA